MLVSGSVFHVTCNLSSCCSFQPQKNTSRKSCRWHRRYMLTGSLDNPLGDGGPRNKDPFSSWPGRWIYPINPGSYWWSLIEGISAITSCILLLDHESMILIIWFLYPDVVTQNGGIDANIVSSSVAAFIQRLADSFNSDPQQDKQEYYMRTVVNKLTAFLPWLSCKSVMFIFLSPQKWECWCNQFHIPAGPLVAVSNMFLLLSLFEKGIQLLLLRLAQKISLRWVK